MRKQLAEVRAEVLGCEELPCAKPDVSHKMLKNLLGEHSPLSHKTHQAGHVRYFK
jgi:hypothetical protein